jgi:hypothetical protein
VVETGCFEHESLVNPSPPFHYFTVYSFSAFQLNSASATIFATNLPTRRYRRIKIDPGRELILIDKNTFSKVVSAAISEQNLQEAQWPVGDW